MQINETIDNGNAIEAVVGVFDTSDDASRVAASLRRHDTKVQRVSRRDPSATDEMPEILFDDVEHVSDSAVVDGMVKGGAIGAGSGLLFLGVPGLNVAAPIVGSLAGAWIGAIAAVDETNRAIELPNLADYRKMLAAGKSFIVIAGDESKRIECARMMEELGAEEVHQHPPVLHAIRNTSSESKL